MQNNESTVVIQAIEEGEQLQSAVAGYIVLGFEFALVVILIGITIYFFSAKRKTTVESPKFSMMEDEDDDNQKQ